MRILFITTQYPWPVEKGGASQRSRFLLDALRKIGHVDVLVSQNAYYFETLGVEPALRQIEGVSIREHRLPYSSNFKPDKEGIAALVREGGYDLVAVRYLRGAARSGAIFLDSVPVLLDIDDVDWMLIRTRNQQAVNRSLIKRFLDTAYEKFMERMARRYLIRFAHVWVANEEDEPEVNVPHASTLPNIPVLPESVEPQPSRADDSSASILFVATLGYPPNGQGLTRFLDCVWARVLEACPNVRLRVVGRLPLDDDALIEKWRRQPNVDLLGPLDSLDEEYERAAFTIAPVYWGGGTKIKVLESLGRGRTCVCAPHALSGIGKQALHKDSIWHGETDEAFAQGCITLLRDSELRHRMEQRGREVIREHYSAERFNKVVAEAVTGALERRRG